jgi:GTP-binding protein
MSQRLSRPERKALERSKKQQQQQQSSSQYGSISKIIPPLPDDCTVHDIIRRLRRRNPTEQLGAIEQRLKQLSSSLLLQGNSETTTDTSPPNSTAWGQLAIAALYQHQHPPHHNDKTTTTNKCLIDRCLVMHENALKHEIIIQAGTTATPLDPQQSSVIPLIRALMSHNRTDTAWHLWEQLRGCEDHINNNNEMTNAAVITIDVSNAALSTMATHHFRRFQPYEALRALSFMTKGTVAVEPQRWIRLAQAAAACQSHLRLVHMNNNERDSDSSIVSLPPNVVHSVLMARFRTDPWYLFDPDPAWYEIVQNALVRRVVFVTGAVSLASCPKPDRGEAVFIGRSNVGKSSLVNLLTNRKSLAYTSKRPGKTQQFNYFAVNDKPGLEKVIQYGDDVKGRADRDCFYIVDVPGFGYAAVPGAIRDHWKDVWQQYVQAQRPTVIFHLMDGRHGPTADDVTMSQMIQTSGSSAKYVVVLTKVDKNGKFQVSDSVQKAVREAIPDDDTPIVWTSAERRWGFDVLWKYLQTAITTD